MADLSITPASVIQGATSPTVRPGVAGETITAGQAVYIDATSKKYLKARANALITSKVVGIALNSSSLDQPINVNIKDDDFTIGATVALLARKS